MSMPDLAAARAPARVAASPASSENAYLEVRKLSKIYATRKGPVRALDRVSLTASRGEFVSVLGPSGCGKSTLLMIAAGLLSASDGSVIVDGCPVTKPRTDLGIVFQSPVLLEWRTALGNIMLQAEARKLDRREAQVRAGELLASVGLAGFADKYPHELSGGMRQRVSICRALIHNPPQLLMDEPFGALDALTRDQLVIDLQRIWNERRITALFVTHSVAEAVFLSDRVIVMTPRPGRIDQIIDIDLPRPRTLAMRESKQFTDYSRQIMDMLLARGVLREEIQTGSSQ
jgi:NitT/TauT family transport system ATP-binding protein